MAANEARFRQSSVWDCPLVKLPKIETEAGAITAVNNAIEIPFSIKRVFYLYDIPAGAERGGHAHKELHQLLIAVSGSFDVMLDDGKDKRVVSLNRPYIGLHVIPGVWNNLFNFSSGAICLVLASEVYQEGDYFRNYDEFKKKKYYDI